MYAGQYVNQDMSKDLQTQALESGEEIAADDPAEPKTAEEFRVERLTWFGLVGVLVITGVLPDWLNLHRGINPACRRTHSDHFGHLAVSAGLAR